MFNRNENHKGTSLLDDYRSMPEDLRKGLQEGWAQKFYDHIFCNIDEEPFEVLYDKDTGAPNKPVNVLLGLEIIKHYKGYSDKELINQFNYNYQIKYALGITDFGSESICPRTLYYFRERVANHLNETGVDLVGLTFDTLREKLKGEFNVEDSNQRMDSSLIEANIRNLNRLQLCINVVQKFLSSLADGDIEKVSDEVAKLKDEDGIKEYKESLKGKDKTNKLEDIGVKIYYLVSLFKSDEGIIGSSEYRLLVRVLSDQFKISTGAGEESEDRVDLEIKTAEEIKSSALQSPSDPDATYREKNGESHKGYKMNATENCYAPPSDDDDEEEEENQAPEELSLLSNIEVYPNNKSDKEILGEEIEELKEKTDLEELITDGGFSGEKVEKKCDNLGTDLKISGIKGRKSGKRESLDEHFEFKAEGESVKCKSGYTPVKAKRNEKQGYTIYKFTRDKCSECPYRNKCPIKEQKKYFSITINDRTVELIKREKELGEVKKKRAPVESVFFVLKHKMGLDKIPVTGLVKVNYWAKLAGIALNFGRVCRFIDQIKEKYGANGLNNFISKKSRGFFWFLELILEKSIQSAELWRKNCFFRKKRFLGFCR